MTSRQFENQYWKEWCRQNFDSKQHKRLYLDNIITVNKYLTVFKIAALPSWLIPSLKAFGIEEEENGNGYDGPWSTNIKADLSRFKGYNE